MRCTIAILCYNQADIIGRTVASALAQTRPADEIIVVDDGSTDESTAVLAQVAEISVIEHGNNRGRTAARNTLLEAATGDVIVYLDGDTVARPDLLEQLLPEFDDEKVGGVGGQGLEVCRDTVYDRWRSDFATQGWGPRRRTDVPWLFGLCFSFRRTALREVGGFFGYCEDQQVCRAIRERGHQLRYVPDALVEHRRRDDRASFEDMLFRWWRGGYLVDRRWGLPALRRMIPELLADQTKQLARHALARDWKMCHVDLIAAAAKVRGMREGRRLWRIEQAAGAPIDRQRAAAR